MTDKLWIVRHMEEANVDGYVFPRVCLTGVFDEQDAALAAAHGVHSELCADVVELPENADEAVAMYLGLKKVAYEATFIPISRTTRKKVEDIPFSDLQVNWEIMLEREGRMLLDPFQFRQGIGHLPQYKQGAFKTLDYVAGIRAGCEQGRTRSTGWTGMVGGTALPKPSAASVLYCLLNDAMAEDYRSFEDWASEFGIDPDSRAGERIYEECLRTHRELRAVLGEGIMDSLRKILEGY